LLIPGLVFAALSLAGIALAAAAPRPDASAADTLDYVQEHPSTMRLSAFLAFTAAVPLALWSATVYRRLRALGVSAPGSAIALSGGLLAAAFAALSGLTNWVASRADDSEPVAAALRDLNFITGGPGFVAFFGLLLAGVSVPLLILDIDRLAGVAGLVFAVVAELSTLALLTSGLDPLLPVARFGGLLWLIAVSARLPYTRRRTVPEATPPEANPPEANPPEANPPEANPPGATAYGVVA
jgi:hypothetical protein